MSGSQGPSVAPRWDLSPDRRTLTMIREEAAGSRIIQLVWTDPATDGQLAAALADRPLPVMVPGERRVTRRLLLGRYVAYLHLMAGPPTWWWPRLFIHERSRVTGWLRRAVAVHITKQRGDSSEAGESRD